MIIMQKGSMGSSSLYNEFQQKNGPISLVTIKRLLSKMVQDDLVQSEGAARSTVYSLTTKGRMLYDVDTKEYCAIDPDIRYGEQRYNLAFFSEISDEIFSEQEYSFLESATQEYLNRVRDVSSTIAQKELERLIIELAWKSSKIEGNTYTLLETELLISEQKEAPGHMKSEATMILNHKDAFSLIYEHADDFKSLTRANLETLHGELIKGLGVSKGIRRSPVGVTGSRYHPLDNSHQITDALQELEKAIDRLSSPYTKACIALLGISYIQPFEDGNKRTSRLMANAILLAYGYAPLSYRSVNEYEYREAMLAFYELNSILPFKKIFLEQYDFAARNYAVKIES